MNAHLRANLGATACGLMNSQVSDGWILKEKEWDSVTCRRCKNSVAYADAQKQWKKR